MKKNIRGSIGNPFFRFQSGISLVEVSISMVVFSLVVLGVFRLLTTNSKSVVQIHKDEKRSALTDYIEMRFKAANFYDVFGVDSAMKGGSPIFSGTIGTYSFAWNSVTPTFYKTPSEYYYGTFWCNWSKSPLKEILLDIDQRVTREGYSRWVVMMTQAQRNTVVVTSTASLALTADLRGYYDGNLDGVDDFNSAYRYSDVDGDGFFFSTFTDTQGRIRSETPNMPFKFMEIFLYKNGTSPVNKRLYFILSPGGLSGEEMGVTTTNLWATLSIPSWRIRQDSVITHDFLTLGQPSGTGFFKNDSFVTVLGTALWVDLPYLSSPGHRATMNVKTTPGATLHCVVDGDPATHTTALVGVTGIGGALRLDSDVATAKLMVPGSHSIKGYVERNGNLSPSYTFGLVMDVWAPTAMVLGPASGSEVHTRTPNVFAVVKDTGPADFQHGVEIFSISMAKTEVANPTSLSQIDYRRFRLPLLENTSEPYRSAYYVNTNGVMAVFVDTGTTWLPWVFNDGETVNMRVEMADACRYKKVEQWSFTVTLPEVDVSTPTVVPVSPLPDASGVGAMAPIVFDVSDPQSGANPYSLVLFLNGSKVLSVDSGSKIGKSLSNYSDPTGVPGTGGFRVTYVPTVPYLHGANSVLVQIFDWKGNSNDTDDPASSYTFTVP